MKHHRLSAFALLIVLATASFTAAAQWTNVPTTVPMPTPVYIVPQPAPIDFSGLANAVNQYGASRSATPAQDTLKPVISYIKKDDGTVVRCETYGENMFCK